jgi:hypothetical protein
MLHPVDIRPCLPRSIRRPPLPMLPAALLSLLAAAATPAWSADEPAQSPMPQVAVAAPAEPEPADATTGEPAVAVVKPPEPATGWDSEQQRRMLMLLIMNSAGPVRPFGNLGR